MTISKSYTVSRSLPNRQLRKARKSWRNCSSCSLPNRQLRKEALRGKPPIELFTAE